MRKARAASPRLMGLEPYDPKYLPARANLSANESPYPAPPRVREAIAAALAEVPLNRYPDPLAAELRAAIAEVEGVEPSQVLVGNGGDELLFDLALAWGGPGRKMLNLPPTFSVYATDARLTGTAVVDVARRADHSIDEEATLARLAEGDIDLVVVTSPNNPTGALAPLGFVEAALGASDAIVVVDEAYGEFSGQTARPLLEEHANLVILRTLSKAYGLAGARLGYLVAREEIIAELLKVRQPYSVDALSQAVGRVVVAHRRDFEPLVEAIVSERERLLEACRALPGVSVAPSDANWVLVRLEAADDDAAAERASAAWEHLYAQGVLVRDFSHAFMLEGCLRVTVGTPEENDLFLAAFEGFLRSEGGAR